MPYTDLIGAAVTALIVTFFSIPSIIKISKIKQLFDKIDERRVHKIPVPTLGGVAMFAGLLFAFTFWASFGGQNQSTQYILCAYIIIFLIGAKDDLVPLTALKKFAGEIVASLLLVYKADIRLTSLYGIFGIYDIPILLSLCLSVFIMLLIINSLNLIDGIDGLAASIGLTACIAFGAWFYIFGKTDLAILAASLSGALIGFLYYNISPARIFMGDTGSLLIGLTMSILAIQFIENNKIWQDNWSIQSVPAVAVAVLIVPLFDTLRVFTLRAIRRKSPFSPDKTHIHHLLLDCGCTHLQATFILVVTNFLFIILAYFLQHIGTLPLLLLLLSLALLLTSLVFIKARQKSSS
jgi:UDP-GlcNAc:undecaprenyl-phosphate/decaprenyl-phosphate GlcNAc-1-phosphate transferase